MKRVALLVSFLLLPAMLQAQPLPRKEVPQPLEPWIDWALHGHEEERCPFFQGDAGRRECAWPSRLVLDAGEREGRFEQSWLLFADTSVALPGDARLWPLDVRVDGAGAAVVTRDGKPSVLLKPGRHVVTGRFAWDAPPPMLPVPGGTGLLRLTLRGATVRFPARDAEGRVWLAKKGPAAEEESGLDVTVMRRVTDDVPLLLTTRIDLTVSGENREELLGRVLPDGFVPLSLEGPLPARLEPDGRLRVQVRAGRFTLDLTARHDGPVETLAPPQPGGPWDTEEVWVFEARPALRLVTVEGVPAIDPQQTTLPPEWRTLPAYLVKPGDVMRLTVKRRGDAEPAPDRLTLQRTLWLDFDGGGGTVHDVIEGTMSASWRLSLPPPYEPGRVIIDGQDQLITRVEPDGPAGVEVRRSALHLEADSRIEQGIADLPAVGWDHDFTGVAATLNLGPGWRLLHATGVDDVEPTWVASWTLLDIFLVVILTLSVARLWGRAAGALALATLGLSWTEPGAPQWSWVAVVACAALVRLFPAGRFRTLLVLARGLALLALVLVAAPFLVSQVRGAIFPALETVPMVTGGGLGPVTTMVYAPPARSVSPPPPPTSAEKMAATGYTSASGTFSQSMDLVEEPKVTATLSSDSNLLAHDPGTVVQTGPGLPDWRWRAVSLRWRGPVQRSQHLRLYLIPPVIGSTLALARAGLVILLGLLVGGIGGSGWRAFRLPIVLLPLLLLPTGTARADLPSKEMLETLRQRLLAPPVCSPDCASIPRLAIEASPSAVTLRLEVLAAAGTAIPLPGGPEGWPSRVSLDGAPAAGLLRGADGRLWMEVPSGSHQVVMDGPVPDRDTIEIPLPLQPHHVTARATGWRVAGLQANGIPEATLQLIRVRAADARARPLTPAVFPPFVRVEREITLGLRWGIRTRVVRVSPGGSSILIEVPLLPGESVTTADMRVRDGKAVVSLGPDAGEVAWTSALKETPEITLHAPDAAAWTEVWLLAVGSVWHAEVEGIPVVHRAAGDTPRLREWRPWPGETVTVRITRPEGVPGRTLTIDSSEMHLAPGLRATDARLDVTLRSSRGGEHTLVLPEGAELQSIAVDGATLPIRPDGREITVPVTPGTREVRLEWREPRGMRWLFSGSTVNLDERSVNSRVEIAVPADRWTLLVGGPRLGPAVIVWGFLIVSLVLSFLLGRTSLTPLRWHHWFLLSLGLTQAPLPVTLLVLVWLFGLGLRGRLGNESDAIWFDLRQLALAVLTAAALIGLFWSIRHGLLGYPEMRIAGNGSSSRLLAWYEDRVVSELPRPWVLSAPLLLYRLAMLAWSLWLAMALLRWLRWGWDCFSEGGLWRRIRKPPAPPRPPEANPAS